MRDSENRPVQFVNLNGVTLHYQVVGDARARPAIAFVNSLGTDFRIWDDVVARLAGEFAVILHDKRGHGLSSIGPTPFSVADHARDLAALLDHLGIRRAVVCGVSVGGQIALRLAADRPALVRGLVLGNTSQKMGDAPFWNARIAAIEEGGMEAVADGILVRWFSPGFAAAEPARYAGYRAMLCRQPVAGYIAACVALRESDLTAVARAIAVPVLCLAGAEDRSTPQAEVESLQRLIPGAALKVIPRAGHLPSIERADALAEIIHVFMDDVETEQLSHVAH